MKRFTSFLIAMILLLNSALALASNPSDPEEPKLPKRGGELRVEKII